MNSLDEDLDDSALICKSLIPKRKAFQNINPKNSKQIKLDAFESLKKTVSQNENELNNGLTNEKATSQSDTKWGESSSYFSVKHSTCPLCLKSFKSDSAYSTHMKQCAKTHKMTTQQLLAALELQKKQMQERKALGLGSLSLTTPRKPVSKKKENSLESYNLALGLALSKSLTTCESTGALQDATLEEFGFAFKNTVTNRKKINNKKLLLKERTAEERQRIIVEKVAVVLLDDKEGGSSDSKVKQIPPSNAQIPQLWNLGENNDKCDWYVAEIKPLVLSNEGTTPEETPPPPPPQNISYKISELKLPQNEFNQSWKKMINNNVKSDLFGRTKDNQDVYLHSLVVFTRCPEILEKDFESILQKFNLSTILTFLEYLYCGTLNSLVASEIDDLFDLSTKINFKELVSVLDILKTKLKENSEIQIIEGLSNNENEAQKTIVEKGKLEFSENKDLFSEDIALSYEGDSDESNAEKSYWSFIQHEKRKQNLLEKDSNKKKDLETPERQTNSKTTESEETKSATGDLIEDVKTSSDCIVLSSGSEPQQGPSTPLVDFDLPAYDPYDHFIAEESLSPVGSNSQSLLMGDISVGSIKLSSPSLERKSEANDGEQKKTVGYCSTPVTAHQSRKIKSSTKGKYRKRRSELSSSRILRKSLGLKNKTAKRRSIKKRGNSHEVVEAFANSVLHELSKSGLFQRENFVEITPLPNRQEFGECVTPSPNYSIMGESLLKEQLTKYGLKKNLAKSKAKKILRHIFEELHPLYNTETGKIVKKLPSNSPKAGKSKSKKTTAKTKKSKVPEKVAVDYNSSTESQNMLDDTIGSNRSNSDGTDFEDLNETLTQSLPSNPVDLPSAFSEFLQNNKDYHQQILLYEPIWLEELQKSLKETFNKHFKMSDLMDYLDRKCVTFRSEAQAKKLQKRHQQKKTSQKISPR